MRVTGSRRPLSRMAERPEVSGGVLGEPQFNAIKLAWALNLKKTHSRHIQKSLQGEAFLYAAKRV